MHDNLLELIPTIGSYWRGRRIVVGGGCGLIGSYVVPQLVRAQADVLVVDTFENGNPSVLAAVADRITIVRGDLSVRASCREWLAEKDLLLNLAARASGVGYSRTHHATMLIDNLLSALVPLSVAQEVGVPHAVVMSSSCVYPVTAPVPTPEIDAFVGDPERVNEGYGWAKRVEELAAEYLRGEAGMKVTVLRPFNVYGGNYPWKSAEHAHVVPMLVKRIMDGDNPLIVWGSGNQRRNFLHGADAAYVILKVIEREEAGPVNIGYEESTRIADLVEVICDVAGRRPAITFDTSKPDGQSVKAADATRLRGLTDAYQPRIALRAGMQDMRRWYERQFSPHA